MTTAPEPGPAIYGPGSFGPDVRLIHARLRELDKKADVDGEGRYGAKTEAAIKAFQAAKNLQPTGLVDALTLRALWPDNGRLFEEVLRDELTAIHTGRSTGIVEEPKEGSMRWAHASMLMGLAFSGGGIRSATFNLGVLQGLAQLGLLRRFDYLSTVSGGGYIGSWLSAYLRSERTQEGQTAAGALEKVEDDLKPGTAARPSDDEAPAIRFLRRYSNYLTPRTGMFSGDTWAGIATYLRNLLLNQLILFSLLISLLLVPRIATNAAAILIDHGWTGWSLAGGLFVAALVLILLSIRYKPTADEDGDTIQLFASYIPALIVVLLFAAAFVGSFAWSTLPGLPPADWGPEAWDWTIGVLGVPAVLAIFGILVVIAIGLGGHWVEEETREWWSRLGGWLMISAIGWFLVAGGSVYGPNLVRNLESWIAEVGLAWIVTTVGGVLAAFSPRSGDGKKADGLPWLNWLARIAPYAFIAGLLLFVSFLLQEFLVWLATPPMAPQLGGASCSLGHMLLPGGGWCDDYYRSIDQVDWYVFLVFVASASFGLVFSWFIDINLFSFHAFYRNRLVRCYLGASNLKRRPRPFTGFDPNDNFDLDSLCLQRPLHIVNTALNLTTGRNLAWQERKAAAFAFTPLYCGYQFPGAGPDCMPCYQRTDRFRPGSLTLGTALAVSGAAASPNQGYHSDPAVAFLMTVFNVRLGWWLPNPRYRRDWDTGGKVRKRAWGLYYLLQELFGMSDDESHYVSVSDGGHFENLGVYELVRRRCRFIVVSDAGHDSAFDFEDLGNAIRKCYVDFGIRIDVDTRALARQGEGRTSVQHCAVGTIRYDLADPGALPGFIVYLKPSLTGSEPTDIRHYAAAHPDFPHQSTANQWFDESQFESYRKLGSHIALAVFEAVRTAPGTLPKNEELFVKLRERWYPQSGARDEIFSRRAEELSRIHEAIRQDEKLRFLDGQVFAEYNRIPGQAGGAAPEYWIPSDPGQLRAGFYICNRMLQLMENVYLDLNLEEQAGHPDNRGWMNLYKRWSWSGMFQLTWSICAGTYGARFQSFVEQRLGLRLGEIGVRELKLRWTGDADELKRDAVKAVEEAFQAGEPGINLVEADLIDQLAREMQGLVAGEELTVYSFHLLVDKPYPNAGKLGQARFPFGFALMHQGVIRYFRVRDHVRRLGLARRAIKALLGSLAKPYPELQLMQLAPARDNPDPAASCRYFTRIFESARFEL